MLTSGVWAASVTPLTASGELDFPSLARQLEWLKLSGVVGAVVGGTHGEAAYLSAIQKRDLIRKATQIAANWPVIAGIQSNSLQEASWLIEQSAKAGAVGALVNLPTFERSLDPGAAISYLRSLLDRATIPCLYYHFPSRFGNDLISEVMRHLADHPRLAGVKWSEKALPTQLPDHWLKFLGYEPLLKEAKQCGWTGLISGCANTIGGPLAKCWDTSDPAWLEIAQSWVNELRALPQPAAHKRWLWLKGIIAHATMALPQTEFTDDSKLKTLEEKFGDPTRMVWPMAQKEASGH